MLAFDSSGPLLVFGGPYSNLRATEALMAVAERLGIPSSRIICTGDVVAYCAEPEETSQRVASWGCHVIQGNCEQQIAAGADDCACNFEEGSACDLLAKGWYPYAKARITDPMRQWMGQLPETLAFSLAGLSFKVVHGGTRDVSRWVFASDTEIIAEECAASGAQITIAGHCGVPFIARAKGAVWFNPGVIGVPPNDGTPEVWYGLIEPVADGVKLSTHRLAYDHAAAAAAMRKHGYANGYARALVTGLWPSLDVFPEPERQATGRRIRAQSLDVKPPRPAIAAE